MQLLLLLLPFHQTRAGGTVSSWRHHWLCCRTLEPVQGSLQHPEREERRYDGSVWAMLNLWMWLRFCFWGHIPWWCIQYWQHYSEMEWCIISNERCWPLWNSLPHRPRRENESHDFWSLLPHWLHVFWKLSTTTFIPFILIDGHCKSEVMIKLKKKLEKLIRLTVNLQLFANMFICSCRLLLLCVSFDR